MGRNAKVVKLATDDDDAFASDMYNINRKKERKLRKDLVIAVNTLFTLGLKCLITEESVSLRAIKLRSFNISQMLKNDELFKWDRPLLNEVIRIMFQHHIDFLNIRRKVAVASMLESDMGALLKLLAVNELLLNPLAV